MSITAKDIAAVLGPVDETIVADIVAADATREELAEAWAWINSDEALIGEGRPLPSGKVAELVDLLSSHQEPPEE